MTTSGLIVLICGCAAWGIFGIYASFHREDSSNIKNKPKQHKHA